MTLATSRKTRPPMTAEAAVRFEHYSAPNATIAAATLRAAGACKGYCEPYADIYTYARWQAQGFQVRKGQHGARLSIMINVDVKVDNSIEEREPVRKVWHTTVFCRCQVDEAQR